MKKLGEILCEKLSAEICDDLKNLPVNNICDNSLNVSEGDMFVAINGTNDDGKKYINDAMQRGAKFIVTQSENFGARKNGDVVFIEVENIRHELANMCENFFDHPRDNFKCVAAVTGTNGKSSTVDITRQIWEHAKISAASIGTLGVAIGNKLEKLSRNLTTPGVLEMQKIFSHLAEQKIQNVALEASSHGLSQNRSDGVNPDICAFTNFTQDHLDYHKTFENYWNAKSKLFSECASSNSIFIVNVDDPYSEKILKIACDRGIKFFGYGRDAKDIKLKNVEQNLEGQLIEISAFGRDYKFALNLCGTFQVYNCLCALGICLHSGVDIESTIEALGQLRQISGRMEKVASHNGADIFIDYSHTPDALKKALISLRATTKNRLVVLFGCGGDRDHEKRKLMGEIAEKFADLMIVTDDNPRFESPETIRKMIIEGAPNATEIADRRTAIQETIKILLPGDILLIAGKGHENYQQVKDQLIHFSDKETVLNIIKNEILLN